MFKIIVLVFITGAAMAGETLDFLRKEIFDTEAAFNEMATKKGLKTAFLHFAADDAVIMRNDKLYKGKEEIAQYFDNHSIVFSKFLWKPDFIDVAESKELAYTYGQYYYEYTDKDGNLKSGEGVFHTVWKKQPDGSWKYVWD